MAVAIAYLSQSKVLTHPKDVFEPRGNPKLSNKDKVLKPMGSGNPGYSGKDGYTMLDHFGRYFISMEHFDPSPCLAEDNFSPGVAQSTGARARSGLSRNGDWAIDGY